MQFQLSMLIIFCLAQVGLVNGQDKLSLTKQDFSKTFVTKDTMFNKPFIDMDEWRDKPVRHRYMHGGFKGTNTRFSFYLPTQQKYQGRFFQYITPTPDSETLSQNAATPESDKISFAIASGAYFIETNGGGALAMQVDPSITSFRANAATAEFSRLIATTLYKGKRPFGYAFGGSGGSLRTIGSIENTTGVWDGVVPYVMPTTMSLPNAMTSVLLARRILKDRLPQVVDALEAGSLTSVDQVLGTEQQKGAFREASSMGFPSGAWKDLGGEDTGGFAVIYPVVRMIDPSYFTDFWTKEGYEGFNAEQSLKDARIQLSSKILKLINAEEALAMGLQYEAFGTDDHGLAANSWKSLLNQTADKKLPVAVQVERTPDEKTNEYDLIVRNGEAAGKELKFQRLEKDVVILTLGNADAAKLKVGDELTFDNTNFLAVQYYHRHQMPGDDFDGWRQYKDSQGKTPYAQRPMLLGPLLTQATAGSLLTGKFQGKMIVIQNMYDGGAFPWNAHWYKNRVKEHLGPNLDKNFRVWFTDHANHGDYPFQKDPTHTIVYLGVLQQALRDLSQWVENGVEPPLSTAYDIRDTQVVIPDNANERNGIQPVVHVKVNGSERAEIKPGETVTLEAVIEVPKKAGKVVSIEWNFGDGKDFLPVSDITKSYKDTSGQFVTVKTTHIYPTSGTFFVTVRAASERSGDIKTPFARIQNLGKARVVVD